MDLLTQKAAETQRNCVIAKVSPGDGSVTELRVPGQQAEPTASTSVLDIERMKGGSTDVSGLKQTHQLD